MKESEFIAKLNEIDERKLVNVTCQLGIVQNGLLNNVCKKTGIKKSRFLRIAFGHYCQYLNNLSQEEIEKELIRVKMFD